MLLEIYKQLKNNEQYGKMVSMNNLEVGSKGEYMAESYLLAKGYVLCDKNLRFGKDEIDIVARKAGEYHLVEVKTSRVDTLAEKYEVINPEWQVTPEKREALTRSAFMFHKERKIPRDQIHIDLAVVYLATEEGVAQITILPDYLVRARS